MLQVADLSRLQHDVLVGDEELGHHPAVRHNAGHPVPEGGEIDRFEFKS